MKRLRRAADIQMKAGSDKDMCDLTGMVLLPGDMMLLCDWSNDSVKLVDLKTGQLVSTLCLLSRPWAVCAAPQQQVAVTLPEEGVIQLLNISVNITKSTSIKIKSNCWAICALKDDFVVTYHDGNIAIVDRKGRELYSRFGQKLFSRPLYISVNASEPAVYVSDIDLHTVTKLDLELKVVRTMKNEQMQTIRSLVAVDEHHLLVSCERSHTIVLLNTKTQKVRVLLDEEKGIQGPKCASYSPENERLYVTCWTLGNAGFCNNVKVFDVIN